MSCANCPMDSCDILPPAATQPLLLPLLSALAAITAQTSALHARQGQEMLSAGPPSGANGRFAGAGLGQVHAKGELQGTEGHPLMRHGTVLT